MRVIAFDFDGVLCDSSREVFAVAIDSLAELEPDLPLVAELVPLRDDAIAGGEAFREHPLYRRFYELLPLGNRAEDFGVALKAISEAASIADQKEYDAFYAEIPEIWRTRYHRRFYEERESLRNAHLEGWLAMHLAYPEVPAAIERHRDSFLPAVATAKDARSVRLLFSKLGLDAVFDDRLILDKEAGVDKTAHLRELQRRTGEPFHHITFIDDKLNHLEKVANLGVSGVLAGWGFNTDRERALALRRGFEVAQLDTIDTLFKGE
jgi:phosphoglycolate phosphatase-like HAD superfamily hydrolase